MKQKDIALIVVTVFISAVFSVLLSNFLIAPSSKRQEKVEIVDKITADFVQYEPDTRYFNKDSVNPTKRITIGQDTNDKPFDGSGN